MVDRCGALVLLLLGSPAAAFVMHVICARLMRRAHRQLVAALAIALAGIAVVALSAALTAFEPWSIAYAMLGYGGIGYSYFHVFNLSETARRIRIMTELSAGPLTAAELLGRYKPEDALTQRIERLIALDRLVLEGNVYRLRGRALIWIARVVLGWRRVLGLPD